MGCDVRECAERAIGAELRSRLDGASGPWCILIDGGSGSGKTTLAKSWAEHPPEWMAPQTGRGSGLCCVVHLDDMYPGWTGLAEASRVVARDVLHPTRPGYRRWDWRRNCPADWVELPAAANLIVEGCGALTHTTVQAARRKYGQAVVSIDINMPLEQRKRRALARDPEFADHWDMWAQQEQRHRASMPQPDVTLCYP